MIVSLWDQPPQVGVLLLGTGFKNVAVGHGIMPEMRQAKRETVRF